jgi:hypothetical protein
MFNAKRILFTLIIAMALALPVNAATVKFANNATSAVANVGGISDIDTSVTVTTGEGALFPAITSPDFFMATLIDTSGNKEIVKVTARVTDTFTIIRAQESTSARAFAADSIISNRLTAGTLNDTWTAIDANREQTLVNLKPAVNAAVNKLDIFTKSGGADPDATNILNVIIPDGSGYTARSRAAAYLSGTSQFILADATDYWSKGDLAAEIKTAWVYAIWDGTGIVWALAGYSGFNMVPTTTTVGDDDYFLLEAGSTYTRNNAHYCVCVGKIRYEYDTGDTPDHTIQATVENAPQVMWNPKSDYGYRSTLATTNTAVASITEYSAVSLVVKQSGKYSIRGNVSGGSDNSSNTNEIYGTIRTGSSTFGSATIKAAGRFFGPKGMIYNNIGISSVVYLNAGDTIHLGAGGTSIDGDFNIAGDNNLVGSTILNFNRVD